MGPLLGKRISSVSVTSDSEITIDKLEESSLFPMQSTTMPLSMLHQQSTLSADETDIQGKVVLETFVKSQNF